MNRSFKAQESQMQAALRQKLRSSMVTKDRDDEELALFLEMKNSEKDHTALLLRDSFADAASVGSNPDNYPLLNISSSAPAPAPGHKTGADDFLSSENDKNDYDWLLTPPGTPLFPSLEMESQKTIMTQLGASTTRPIALKSRLANPLSEHTGRSNLVSKQSPSSPRLTSSGGGTRRPSSSGNPGSRPSTPTGRPTLTTTSNSSRPSTATSRTSLPSTRTVATTTKTKITVSATKTTVSVTNTTTVPAAKPTAPSRSSTPLSRSTARSSTPTSKPTLSASRSTSRASTPTRRPTTPSNVPDVSAPSLKTSSISKPAPLVSKQVISKQPEPLRGTSPTVISRPWKPSEMPGFSHDAPPNLRTTLLERPLSATRGRPGAPTARSSSIEPVSSGRPKRQSCSPSRGRSFNGISHKSGSSVPAVSRGYFKGNNSPVIMGTKMVERVINMRKLEPPRLDSKNSLHNNLSAKSSSSSDSSGFGRTMSKKSLDMAIRHMNIRQRVPGNLRPLMTNIPASSMYSVRSGYQHSLTGVSGSPHATSSNASS